VDRLTVLGRIPEAGRFGKTFGNRCVGIPLVVSGSRLGAYKFVGLGPTVELVFLTTDARRTIMYKRVQCWLTNESAAARNKDRALLRRTQ